MTVAVGFLVQLWQLGECFEVDPDTPGQTCLNGTEYRQALTFDELSLTQQFRGRDIKYFCQRNDNETTVCKILTKLSRKEMKKFQSREIPSIDSKRICAKSHAIKMLPLRGVTLIQGHYVQFNIPYR